MNRIRKRRLLLVAGVSAILAIGAYGYTAANTVPDTKAGDGSGEITGYEISNVHYGLNETNPQNIDEVTFDLDEAPVTGSNIEIKLVSSGSDWYSCTSSGTAVTCDTTSPQAAVIDADELTVVVTD